MSFVESEPALQRSVVDDNQESGFLAGGIGQRDLGLTGAFNDMHDGGGGLAR